MIGSGRKHTCMRHSRESGTPLKADTRALASRKGPTVALQPQPEKMSRLASNR